MTDGMPRSRRWSSRLLADALIIAAFCAVVAVLLRADTVLAALPAQSTSNILTLSAAAVGAGSAILAVVASRLMGERKLAWIAAALVLYCAIAALQLPESDTLRWLVEGPVVTVAVLVGWTAVAGATVAGGIRRRCNPWLRLGLGLVVLAVAQVYRVATITQTVTTNPAFAALRLIGLGVVLVGLAHLVQRSMANLRSESWQQQEELAVAALHMERAGELAVERDHELRNGLAGLAGITHLLSADTGGEDHDRLKHAVLAELGRLHRILDGEAPEPDVDPPLAVYAVGPVLEGLVALRPDGPELVVEPGLRARGDAAVLAQVVTNLLANCERHAPGTPVMVRAERRGADVVVEVRDGGPGLPPGVDAASALDRGVHDEAAGGSGLGLYISRRLIDQESGSLRLESVDDPPGCLVTVTVPAVDLPLAVPADR